MIAHFISGQIRQHSLTLAWVREQGGDTLSNIHPSLTNELRLRAILLRERLTSFPLGQDVEGISNYPLLLITTDQS